MASFNLTQTEKTTDNLNMMDELDINTTGTPAPNPPAPNPPAPDLSTSNSITEIAKAFGISTDATSTDVSSSIIVSKIDKRVAGKYYEANVIVCIRNGNSYDPIYEEVSTSTSTNMICFIINNGAVTELKKKLQDCTMECNNKVAEIYTTMTNVATENVVFYWECCSGCCGSHSAITGKHTEYSIGADSIALIKLLLDRKIMTMCADFSLKGLIADWDSTLLGPCPFETIGEISGTLNYKFTPAELIKCSSAQLNIVGKLSTTGDASIRAMGGTIVYKVNHTDTPLYNVNVLTVACDGASDISKRTITSDGKYSGVAGHVMITYANGGQLLVSNGHFIELSHLDTSTDRLYAVMEEQYGSEYSNNVQKQMKSMSATERDLSAQKIVHRMVSNTAPCTQSYSQQNNQNADDDVM